MTSTIILASTFSLFFFVFLPVLSDLGEEIFAAIAGAFGFAGDVNCTKSLTNVKSIGCIIFWMVLTQAVLEAFFLFQMVI